MPLVRKLRDITGEAMRIRRMRRAHVPRPPKDGLVIEVGGGQSPHPRADLMVEKYVIDDSERPHGAPMDFSRPIVIADGERLPFVDDAAAYVIAMHVLEHAVDPAAFASEMSRVGRAGFVQVPSSLSEDVFGWPFHPWKVDRGVPGEDLRFTPKSPSEPPHGAYFHESFADSILFRLWWKSRRSDWHISVEWAHELRVEVETGTATRAVAADFDVDGTVEVLERLARDGSATGPSEAMRRLLHCVFCSGALHGHEGNQLECQSCGRAFPHPGRIPVLVPEAAF